MMKIVSVLLLITCLSTAMSSILAASEPDFDTKVIEQVTGLKGKYTPEEKVFKISQPRVDEKVSVDGMQLSPFMGLTSWAAFTPVHNHVMMMGDTVVFEDEVNPAMSAAFDAGLEVTALHNHFFFDNPKVYFMHIGGMGEPEALANGVKQVYKKIAEIRKSNPEPQKSFLGNVSTQNNINGSEIEKILGVKGESKDGMFKVSIGRDSSMHGAKIGNAMGVNTWAAFAGTNVEAVVDGDFAMLKDEMQDVLQIIRKGNINVVAIHQHMTDDNPHYFFMHYWGKGKALDLAKTIRLALDKQKR